MKKREACALKLLLIEDNLGDAHLIEEYLLLSQSKDKIHHVNSLSEAVHVLSMSRFDLILCDLMLPDAQGLGTLSKLLTYATSTPIIVLTGLQDEALGLNAVQEGAQDYLIKDQLSPSLLTRTVRYTYERWNFRKESELRLQRSEERFKRLTEATFEAIAVSKDNVLTDVNDNFCDLFGYDRTEVIGKPITDLVVLYDTEKLTNQTFSVYEHASEVTCIKQNRATFAAEVRGKVLPTEDGGLRVLAINDITERKRSEAKLHFDAFHDPLTGLKNRTAFTEQLVQVNEYSKRYTDTMYAVLFIDLDRFKPINDTFGHSVGDTLLVSIGRRLKDCVRAVDTVARLGGDEFIVLLRDVGSETNAVTVASNILGCITQPFDVEGQQLEVTASIGIALNNGTSAHPEYLIRNADAAMYHAKAKGKNAFVVFRDEMRLESLSLTKLEADLKEAFVKRALEVYYQPILSLACKKVTGFEALLRWQKDDGAFVPPSEFVPVAEDIGLIDDMGRWVFREACERLKDWHSLNSSLRMHINLSVKQLNDLDFADWVAQTLAEVQLDPQYICLEITESIVMSNLEPATTVLDKLNQLGVHLQIDDFGTGYSSLAYLHSFPVDALKIDRSFVSRLSALKSKSGEIVQTILALSKSLGLSVVAEGIETQEQLAQLTGMGCHAGQGFLFSRAVPAYKCVGLLQADRALNV